MRETKTILDILKGPPDQSQQVRGRELSNLSVENIGTAFKNDVIVSDYFSSMCLKMMAKPNRKELFIIWMFCREEISESLHQAHSRFKH